MSWEGRGPGRYEAWRFLGSVSETVASRRAGCAPPALPGATGGGALASQVDIATRREVLSLGNHALKGRSYPRFRPEAPFFGRRPTRGFQGRGELRERPPPGRSRTKKPDGVRGGAPGDGTGRGGGGELAGSYRPRSNLPVDKTIPPQ
ncbi:hypothetical protein GCM10010317_015040 [Streptomyces mirabilis]|nr:hypothetical protein GCM10010317_015040 [Streptomyces mirabilis]